MDNISLIIPCLNEELYISTLLSSLQKQSDKNFEVIVVDGNSYDDTVGVVRGFIRPNFQLKILALNTNGVSKQRNAGARIARSKHLLFIDADNRLSVNFIAKYRSEINKGNTDILTTYTWPDSLNVLDWLFWACGNLILEVGRLFNPYALGTNLYFNADVFWSIGGFDESLKVAEDADLVRRAFRKGFKFRIFKSRILYTSVRRLNREGRFGFALQLLKLNWQAYWRGSYALSDIDYKFGDWDRKLNK